MSSTLDEQIGTIETTGEGPEGVDFRLPRRELGRIRLVLWSLVGVCLAFEYWLLADPIARAIRQGAGFGSLVWLGVWAFLAFQVWRYPLWHLLVLLYGHRQIGLRSDWLYAGDRLGFRQKNKRWPLCRIKQLQIVDLNPKLGSSAQLRATLAASGREVPLPVVGPGTLTSDVVRHLNALTGVLDDGRRILLAAAYPRPLLERLSRDLWTQIAIARGDEDVDDLNLVPNGAPATSAVAEATRHIENPPVIGISELIVEAKENVRKAREPDVLEQPAGSNVEVESFADGISMRVPPLGVWKGSGGTFQIGLLFVIVTAGFTVLFAGASIAQGGPGAASAVLGAVGVMSIFWIVSGGILYAGWMMGTRETAVAVAGDRVMVMQTGLRRAKRREWPRSEIKTARVGPSGTEINDKPVLELQLLGAQQSKLFGMLAGRDVQELHWMATLLRQAIKTSEPQPTDQQSFADSSVPAQDGSSSQ